jgi:hypothetical protein
MPVDNGVRTGNVTGDAAADRIVKVSSGRGLEVRDGSTANVVRLPTTEFVTDVELIRESSTDRHDLVILGYPNADRGGTLSVIRLPDTTPKAEWKEPASPGDVGIGQWQRMPAIFYFVPDAISVRASDGRELARVAVAGVYSFSRVHVGTLGDGRTAILGSGDGYTPYHMVAIVNGQGQLVFHEQADEHAWRLTVGGDGKSFDVDTRSKRWRYKTE